MKFQIIFMLVLVLFVSGVSMSADRQKVIGKVTSKPFGTVHDKQVFSFLLKNSKGLEAEVTNFGASLISLKVPDRKANFEDVVLGYDDVQGYQNGTSYFGATVGRYGNRIAKGKFLLDGQTYTLAKNDGENTLHGGNKGFSKVVWEAKDVSTKGVAAVQFTYASQDGEEGYPGNLLARITYTLTEDNELRLDYDVLTDKDTVQNLTHHSYFNLNPAARDILSHELLLNADRFTPVDGTLIPTGELRNVAGTPFDFRTSKTIGSRIQGTDEQLVRGKGYDHNWVLNGGSGQLRVAAQVYEPTTGRTLEVTTTEPGVQFYSGNFLNGEKGKGGKPYEHRSGFCLETQHFPDSPNQPGFPSTTLKAGKHYRTTTIYRFGTK